MVSLCPRTPSTQCSQSLGLPHKTRRGHQIGHPLSHFVRSWGDLGPGTPPELLQEFTPYCLHISFVEDAFLIPSEGPSIRVHQIPWRARSCPNRLLRLLTVDNNGNHSGVLFFGKVIDKFPHNVLSPSIVGISSHENSTDVSKSRSLESSETKGAHRRR